MWRVRRADLVFGDAFKRGLEVGWWSGSGWVEVAIVEMRDVRRWRVEGRLREAAIVGII